MRIPPNIPTANNRITIPLIISTKVSSNIDKNSFFMCSLDFINYRGDDGKPFLMPDKDYNKN